MAAESQSVKKVLFFGNSYTYVNDLPGMISLVARSKGDSVIHDQSTPGGCTFQLHCQNPVTQTLIDEANWDYVVLQEQSQLPSWPPDSVQLLVYPYADTLNMWIKQHDSCSKTLFFMTWGRQNGDVDNCPWYPQVCTFTGMQARLRQSYLEMGQMNNAEVSPVGIAWQTTRSLYPNIELYISDGSHPSIYGTYLASCTFYSVIFQKSPVGTYYPASIPADTAAILQQIAYHTVFDSLSVWYVDTTKVHARFTASNLGGRTFQFTNTSLNALNYLWDFGDQSHSTEINPIHTFSSSGDYLVKLYAQRNCDTNSFSRQEIVLGMDPGNMDSGNAVDAIILYPNPASGKGYVKTSWLDINSPADYSVIDSDGKVVLTGKVDKAQPFISMEELKSGVYVVKLGAVLEKVVVR
jgi:hypothetical protein